MVATYGIPVGARVLDLGCGAGSTTLHVAERGFDAYGVDIAPPAIAWAKENARHQNACAQFSVCSGTDLRLVQDDFFDLVLDGHCLWMVLGADRQGTLDANGRYGYALLGSRDCMPLLSSGRTTEEYSWSRGLFNVSGVALAPRARGGRRTSTWTRTLKSRSWLFKSGQVRVDQ
jgi:SAM-dependent methyltransferase